MRKEAQNIKEEAIAPRFSGDLILRSPMKVAREKHSGAFSPRRSGTFKSSMYPNDGCIVCDPVAIICTRRPIISSAVRPIYDEYKLVHVSSLD